MPVFNEIWAISSAGRAPGSQSGGQGFDPPMVHQRKGQPKGCPFLWWGTDAVRTPGSNTRISFAHAKAPRSGGAAAPAKSEVSRSEAEYPPVFHQIKRTAERLSFPLVGHRRGENPRFEHKDFFCACKSAAQRRGGGAGQIRSVTERSGVSPCVPSNIKGVRSAHSLAENE